MALRKACDRTRKRSNKMYGWKPAGYPLVIVAWLWVFWSKELTVSVLRIGGETGWDELNAGERGYPSSNSISSIGIWFRFSSVLMGVARTS